MLVGNKLDLVNKEASARKVAKEEGKKLAAENNLLYVETSAFEGLNIQQAFEELLNGIKEIFKTKYFSYFLAIHDRKRQSDEPKSNGNHKNVVLGESDASKNNNESGGGVCKGC